MPGRHAAALREQGPPRIAFDLDETLGVPLIEGDAIVGFQVRPGCPELLDRLRPSFTLGLLPVLWMDLAQAPSRACQFSWRL